MDVKFFILFEKCRIFDCDCDVKFLGLNNIPTFYTDVLNASAEVREQTSAMKSALEI